MDKLIPIAHAVNIPGVGPIDSSVGFGVIVGRLLTFIFALAGVLAVIYLVYAGIQYITAGGDTSKAGLARQGIVNAIIGIIVILLAVLIVKWVTSIIQSGGA